MRFESLLSNFIGRVGPTGDLYCSCSCLDIPCGHSCSLSQTAIHLPTSAPDRLRSSAVEQFSSPDRLENPADKLDRKAFASFDIGYAVDEEFFEERFQNCGSRSLRSKLVSVLRGCAGLNFLEPLVVFFRQSSIFERAPSCVLNVAILDICDRSVLNSMLDGSATSEDAAHTPNEICSLFTIEGWPGK